MHNPKKILTFAPKIQKVMTEEERAKMKAASDSAPFQKNFVRDLERYAREWKPSTAINTMPWNANGLAVPRDVFSSEAAIDERALVHDHAISLCTSFGLSGQRGFDAYNAVAAAYDKFIKKGAVADSDLDPSSVFSLEEFSDIASKA